MNLERRIVYNRVLNHACLQDWNVGRLGKESLREVGRLVKESIYSPGYTTKMQYQLKEELRVHNFENKEIIAISWV